MDRTSLKEAPRVGRTVAASMLLCACAPLLACLAVVAYVKARFRGPGVRPIEVPECLGDTPGVKTMSEVMETLRRVEFHARMPRALAGALIGLLDLIPMALNTNRITAGLVYPYPSAFEPLMLESRDGTPVCGMLALQEDAGARPALILVHGLYSCKNTIGILDLAVRAFYRWGFHVLALDLRNFGDSGRFSEAPTSWGYRESDDILAAAEYLASLDQVTTVGVCGVSLGAASTLLAAGRAPAEGPLSGGVVALNGFSDCARIMDHVMTMGRPAVERTGIDFFFHLLLAAKTLLSGPRVFFDLRTYTREVSCQYYEISSEELDRKASPVNAVREIEVPCLIVHAEDDFIVPVRDAEELLEAALDNPMVEGLVVPTGSHSLYPFVSRRWFFEVLHTFFAYWGDFSLVSDSRSWAVGADMDIFGNPNN
ncbi:MAG: alpha/beta fold hydrolase [Actinobacteria bacterium]|nr:alpha/beta fold hydrolase [Actinomycetota bacterium]